MIVKRLFVTAVTAVAAATALAVPAQAADASAAASSTLILSVIPASGVQRSVTLECFPTGGPHPKAEQACADLTPVFGDPRFIKPGTGLCPQVVAPVTGTATGVWMGRLVDYSARYQNYCSLVLHTGNVFTF